jgi:adenosylmethionine-8-amino-7-oxononanoate aminotransferase
MQQRRGYAQSALLKQRLDQSYPTVTHGVGVYLYDAEGHDYLDGSSGAMTASLGHGVSELADALSTQAREVAFTYRTQFTNRPAEELARRLAERAPGDLNTAFFVNSGSEATEFAIRAAVKHWVGQGLPAKVKVLSRQTSYHGMTMGALSMSGHPSRRPDYGSLLHPFPVAPPAYGYRFALPEETEEAYAARAAGEVEAAIMAEEPDTVAAFILEPIVGAAGGVLVPPPGYLAAVADACQRLGVLLIADEVITGMGRTGEWFACGEEGVVPDLLVLGKGLSAGYYPMAGVLLRDHLVESLRVTDSVAPFGHTFSGNPLGSATCIAVMDILERQDVMVNVRARGRELEQGLKQLAGRFPFVADVRGRGLLWGFELVGDTGTREPLHVEGGASNALAQHCATAGLIIYPCGVPPLSNSLLISPPLTISSDEMRVLLERLEVGLVALAAERLS